MIDPAPAQAPDGDDGLGRPRTHAQRPSGPRRWPWLLSLSLACCSSQCEPDARYQTRGLVRAFEGQGSEARVAIHHEPLPNFEDRDGKRSPMQSMTMLFGLGSALTTTKLQPGSKLAFEFEVRWDERPTLVITKLEQLPIATQLALSADH